MEIKIVKSEKKPLLSREEYILEIKGSKVPSNAELRKYISENMKKDESLVLIKRINQKFGSYYSIADAVTYHDAAALKKFERFRKEKKKPGAAA